MMSDLISRQAAIDATNKAFDRETLLNRFVRKVAIDAIEQLPSAQPESCEYYALCRHGRDENKLRARLGFCEYCNEDSDGYVRPIEKNSHAWLVRRGRTMKLRICFKGEYRECDILFCPMCGRRLTDG